MKVIIITLYKGSFPFIDELLYQLDKKNVEVCVFDMIDMYTVKIDNGITSIEYHIKNETFRKIFGIRFLGTALKIVFYKIYLRQVNFTCDHINIHYALPYYTRFINLFLRKAKSISAVIWGSDFYRVTDNKRDKMLPLFKGCDSILIPNTQLADSFSQFYKNGIEKKIRSVGFGIGKLDVIKEFQKETDNTVLKVSLGIPTNKRIVTVGYNGLQAQQHSMILNAIADLDHAIKERLFIVVPFGYGGDAEYKAEIINKIKSLNVDYKVFDSFISDTDIAKLRISTDLVINAQVSDGSSASLQEHFYAGNVLLVGDWLQYDHFKDIGIKFWRFNENNILEMLHSILIDFDIYEDEVCDNPELIYNLSSWNSRIEQWISVFKNELPS